MNLPLLLAYLAAVFTLMFTPGPVIALVTATAARHGFRKAFATVLGTNFASLILMAVSVLILAGILTLHADYLYAFGVLGSLFIGVTAARTLVETFRQRQEGVTTPDYKSGGIIRGFLTGIANPKDILFFLSFFPQFITITHSFTASVLTLSLIWIVVDFSIMALYIFAFRNWVSEKHSRNIERVSCVFLLAVGIVGAGYNLEHLF